jgi:hypothetical protein
MMSRSARKNEISGYTGVMEAFNEDWDSLIVWAIETRRLRAEDIL